MPKVVKKGTNEEINLPKAKVVRKGTDEEITTATDFSLEHPALAEIAGEPPEAVDYIRHYGGRFIPDAVKIIGGAGGGIGAGIGSGGVAATVGATAGTAVGSGIGTGLQKMNPRLFGAPPEDRNSQIIEDALVMGAGGELGGRFLTGTVNKIRGLLQPGLKGRVAASIFKATDNPSIGNALAKEQTEQGVKKFVYPESQVLDVMAENAQLSKITGPVRDSLDKLKLPSGGATYKEVSENIFKDVSNVRQAKLIDPTATRQLAQSRLVDSVFDGKKLTVNASAGLKALNSTEKEIYKEALGKEGYDTLTQFFKEAKSLETESGGRVLNYFKERFTLAIPAAVLGGGISGGSGAIAAGAATLLFGNAALKKLMNNPDTVKVALQALRTPNTKMIPQSQMLSQIIINSIRGTEVYIQTPDDKLQKAYVNENGQLQYERPREFR